MLSNKEEHEYDIGDTYYHIDIQKRLESINDTNLNENLEVISKSIFLRNEENMSIFIEDVINILSIRPKSLNILVRLIGELLTNFTLNPNKTIFKNIFLNVIFKPIGDWKFVLKIPLFLFLRECYLQRYISLFDITEKVNEQLQNDCKSRNTLCIILSVFAAEFDRYDSKLFDRLCKNMKNHDQGSFFNIFLEQYAHEFEEFRPGNWSRLQEIVESRGPEAAIHNALKNDDVEFIQRMTINERFNPNRPLDDLPFEKCLYIQGSPSMIQCAAFYGSIKCFKFLYLNKASLQMKDRRDRNILDFASAGGNLEIIRILENCNLSFRNCFKVSMQFRHFDIFDWLVLMKNDDTNNFQKRIDQILCMCCRIDTLEGVIHSLKYGANPNAHIDGMTPFLYAAMNGNSEILSFLFKYTTIDVAEKNKDGKNALHFAVSSGRIEAVRFILETGKVDINSHSGDGSTALHIAAKYGHNKIFDYLLQFPQIDINAVDLIGATPLHYAAAYVHAEIVKMILMCKSCDMTKKTTNDGKTAFEISRNSRIRAMITEALSYSDHIT